MSFYECLNVMRKTSKCIGCDIRVMRCTGSLRNGLRKNQGKRTIIKMVHSMQR